MPRLLQNIDIEGVDVGFWKLIESADDLYSMASAYVSDGELTVYQSFKNDRRRREWLATLILLNEMHGSYPGIDYDSNGAPRLKGDAHINISVSHADGLVAASMSKKYHVGIDVERVTNRVLRIKDKFLTPDEYDINDPNLLQLLYIQWCAKEAMYKACNVAHYDYQNTYTLPGFRFDGKMPGSAIGRVILDDGSCKNLNVRYFDVDDCVVCVAM